VKNLANRHFPARATVSRFQPRRPTALMFRCERFWPERSDPGWYHEFICPSPSTCQTIHQGQLGAPVQDTREGVWPPLLSAFCVDTSPTNQRHPDCSVPGCICPCYSRRSQATWKLKARGVMPSNDVADFSQAESVGLMEKLERLGGNRHSTRVSSRWCAGSGFRGK